MSFKGGWFALGGMLLLLTALGYGLLGSVGKEPGKLQLRVTNQQIQDGSLVISVVTTNAGSAVLVNDGNCEVRYLVDGAWSTNSLPGFRTTIASLFPRQVHTARIKLPLATSRFQV